MGDLEEAQAEVQQLTRQQKKYQQSIQSLEEELNVAKRTKRMSTGLDMDDFKAEITR